MHLRSITSAAVIAGALALSTAAMAAPGFATGNVNMRDGPGTQFGVITTILAGAPLEVFGCQSWCQVAYAGRQGYVSGSYVSSGGGYVQPAPRAYYRAAPPPRYFTPGPAPAPGVYHQNRNNWSWRGDYDRDDWRWRHRNRSGGGIFFQFGS